MKKLICLVTALLIVTSSSFSQTQLLKVGSAAQFSNETNWFWLVLTTQTISINNKTYFQRQNYTPWSDQVYDSNISYERIEGDSAYYIFIGDYEDSLVFNFKWGAGKVFSTDTIGNSINEERIDSIKVGTIYIPQDTIYFIGNYSIDIATGDTSYWIPPAYEYTKKLGRVEYGIWVYLSGVKVDGVRYGFVLPYPEEVDCLEKSIYIPAEGDTGSVTFINTSDYFVSLDSILTNSIYGYSGKFNFQGQEKYFYLVQYYPNQYNDTLTINIPAHDSIRVSFFSVDLCPICDYNPQEYFIDTLRFVFSFHAQYDYEFSKTIQISGQGHLSDINDRELSPNKFELFQNYPNPFNPITNVRYTIGSPEISLIVLR